MPDFRCRWILTPADQVVLPTLRMDQARPPLPLDHLLPPPPPLDQLPPPLLDHQFLESYLLYKTKAQIEDEADSQEIVEAQEVEDVVLPQRQKNLGDDHRYAAYFGLKVISRDKEIEKTDKEHVASLLKTSVRTVERIWKEANEQIARGEEVDVRSKMKGRSGRKRSNLDLTRISSIPLNQRSSMRALAYQLNVPYTTLQRRFKWGEIRHHTSSIKPFLRPKNKIERLKFCISMLDQGTLQNAMPAFNDMQHIIHIDEKWFDLTKKNRTYYLLPEESDPHRTVQNKNSIGKVMFLFAVTRPRFDAFGGLIWDGKIGVWAFVKEEPAVRNSKNRDKGTMEIKNVIVTRDVMREFICDKVIPAIDLVHWPDDDEGTIYIQQDNARTHILHNDPAFLEAVEKTGMDIRLMHQPPNSPDLNVLDLGFFNSIQSLTKKSAPNNLKELIESVEEAYDNYDVETLNKVFLSLQSVMEDIMKVEGGNEYKMRHMNKDAMIRAGTLPRVLIVDGELVQKTLDLIQGLEANN